MTLLVYIILACAGRHYLISECFTCARTRAHGPSTKATNNWSYLQTYLFEYYSKGVVFALQMKLLGRLMVSKLRKAGWMSMNQKGFPPPNLRTRTDTEGLVWSMLGLEWLPGKPNPQLIEKISLVQDHLALIYKWGNSLSPHLNTNFCWYAIVIDNFIFLFFINITVLFIFG